MRLGWMSLASLALLAAASLPGWGQAEPTASPGPGAAPPATDSSAPRATPAPTARELLLLERIRQLKSPRWRSYGACRYDWSNWRLAEGAVRTTDVECGPENNRAVAAVHCDTLQVSRREADGPWSPWRLPLTSAESKASGGEDQMVAALCANLRPAPAGGAAPAPLNALPTPATATPAATPAKARPAAPKPAASTAPGR